ncbi:MAG: energy transducer TonB, partial [Chitinophagales bacterium]|nr:energy transducer TonB [Chitinophagales bacterium]
AYLQNKLSEREKVLFEKMMAQDEFLSDAVEGFQFMPVQDISKFVDAIFQDIDVTTGRRTKSKLVSIQTRPLAIAALLLIFIGISWFAVYFVNNSVREQQIAKTEEVYDEGTNQTLPALKDETTRSDSEIIPPQSNTSDKRLEKALADTAVTEKNVQGLAAIAEENKTDDTKLQLSESANAVFDTEKEDIQDLDEKQIITGTSTQTSTKSVEAGESIATDKEYKKEKKKAEKDAVLFNENTSSAPETSDYLYSNDSITTYTVVDQMPVYPGGENALEQYLKNSIQYPEHARDAGVEGQVLVQFVIYGDGSVRDEKILNGIGFGCDEEAARIIRNMPKWIPGYNDGYPVKVAYTVAVEFKLE